jgi:hypothetical protein
MLTDPAAPTTTNPLPVMWGGPDPLLAAVRTVPLLGSLLPAPQSVRWDVPATYRITLRRRDARHPNGCYEAVLLDTAP